MSIVGSSLNGITVNPKFIFGVNGEIKNNIYLLEDHRLVYSAGHNIVLYNTEDKSQYFFPGKYHSDLPLLNSKIHYVVCK